MDEYDYEMQDDDAYEGPDANVDDDDEIECEIGEAIEWVTQPRDDGSVQSVLHCAYQHFFQCLVYIKDLCSTICNAEW